MSADIGAKAFHRSDMAGINEVALNTWGLREMVWRHGVLLAAPLAWCPMHALRLVGASERAMVDIVAEADLDPLTDLFSWRGLQARIDAFCGTSVRVGESLGMASPTISSASTNSSHSQAGVRIKKEATRRATKCLNEGRVSARSSRHSG